MYIGPQGIVHGTTITVLNAFRKIKKSPKGGLCDFWFRRNVWSSTKSQTLLVVSRFVQKLNPKIAKFVTNKNGLMKFMKI